MNTYFFLSLIVSSLFSCTNSNSKSLQTFEEVKVENIIKQTATLEIDSVKLGLNFKPINDYKSSKNEISLLKKKLSNQYNMISLDAYKNTFIDSLSDIFEEKLLNTIVPHWYGTIWDFNGYTSIPKDGTIACGYFVSTTLKDFGLNINRYKLAQQNPKNEAKSIAILKENIIQITNANIQPFLKELKSGLYFIGLDNHVGYLYIKENESYFLHSNFIDGYVMMEKTELSEAFYSSEYFISEISNNRELLKKWLLNEEFYIFQ